jgi:tetratricopeptide (TPR) repeat protein
MVGAFGEVQVVDWGLAKVLRQGGVADERRAKAAPDVSVIATVRSGSVGSESVVGSVLGTPAYMPPEQARGMVDSLDEKSDVFSLGAVLCEILTGRPPYVGDGRELLVAAARAELDGAFERLDACGADDKVVRICKGCLSAAAAARPANAGELAEQVSMFLAAAEERVRIAEIDAAKSAARADAECGRAEEAAARADAEREKRAQAQRARRMTLALAAVVLVAVVGGGLAWRMAEVGRMSREHAAEAAFATAMDEADILRRRAESGQDLRLWDDAEAASRRADAAAAAADVPAAARERAAAFRAAFDPALVNVRAAVAADARAIGLGRSGDDDGAIAASQEAIRRLPRHAEFRTHLSNAYVRRNVWRLAAAEARAATELDPADPLAAEKYAVALIEWYEFGQARDAAKRAVALAPDDEHCYLTLGNACAGLDLWDEAEAATKEALRWRPGWASAETNLGAFAERRKVQPQIEALVRGERPLNAESWAQLGEVLVQRSGRFVDAVACYEKWMELGPDDASKVWEAGRYNAACFAARAGAGEGRSAKPLDDAAKSEFRAKARKWLAADVAEWKHLMEAGGNVTPTGMVKTLAWAQEDGDLAPIRDEEFTSKWPEEERKTCAALWTELDAVLAKARAAAPPTPK